MSLMDTIDLPLKSPTTELLLYENPISTLLYDIRTSEAHYRDQLSKLLGCCSPLKKQSSNAFTNSVRKLIAYHTDLVRSLDCAAEDETITNFIQWVRDAIPVYQNYVLNYQLDIDTLKPEVVLRKAPLVRINQLNKFFNKIEEINENNPITVQYDGVLRNLVKLVSMVRDKNEMENLKIDLNTLFFDNVHSLHPDFYKTVAYFKLEHCIKRDYFKFDLIHPKRHFNDQLVEVYHLSNNTIAICSVESMGRSLMFPLLKTNEFDIIQNDLSLIQIVNDDEVELRFTCPEKTQLSYWNNVMSCMFQSGEVDNGFNNRFEKLATLRNNKLGLGITMESNQSLGSSLRKSSQILSKHPSLLVSNENDNILKEKSPNFTNIERFFAHDADLEKLNVETNSKEALSRNDSITPRLNTVSKSTTKDSFSSPEEEIPPSVVEMGSPSPTLPLNIKKSAPIMMKLEDFDNSSTLSLPNFHTSKASLNINQQVSGSSVDLSRFDNIKPNLKVKKRKSIFNLFSKKHSEPDFEIVTKPTSTTTSTPTPTPSVSNSTSISSLTNSNETITKPSQSMASLQKNVKKLTITTAKSNTPTESPLPSPFGRSNIQSRSLTPLEEISLINSTVQRVLKNNTIVSKWSGNSWKSIGEEYNHVLKFLSTPNGRVLVVFNTDDSMIPCLMIPTDGASFAKSSALDIQIKCFESLESKKSIMMNIRVKDGYTLNLIINEFENKIEMLSASNSDVFSAPSNSTSMSSVSVDDITDLGKPSVYKTSQSGSNSSLHNKTLLLKSDVKVKLHKMDEDEEWRPVALGKFNISSNLGNPQYSKFEISCINKFKVDSIVKNLQCERIGKSGLRFPCDDDNELYLIEFRNSKECLEIYEMLI